MSVINQMLRDLEHRKHKMSVSEHYIDEVNIVVKTKLNPWWGVLSLLTVLALAGLYFYWFSNENVSDTISSHSNKEELLKLPVDISEIKQAEKIRPDLIAAARDNSENTYQQPSIKTTVELKPRVKTNEQKESITQAVKVKIKPISQSEIVKEIVKEKVKASEQTSVKIKSGSIIKTTSPSGIKTKSSSNTNAVVKVRTSSATKIVNKKSTEQVVYQARELMLSNQNAAIQLLKDNLKLIKPDVDYYSLLANLQQRQKQYDGAIISYRKALEIAPYQGELWIGIALAYRGTGEDKNAVKAFKQAITTDSLSPELRSYASMQINL